MPWRTSFQNYREGRTRANRLGDSSVWKARTVTDVVVGNMKHFGLKLIAAGVLALGCVGLSDQVHATGCHEVGVTNTVHVRTVDKWKPRFWFGNVDDPVPPSDYRPKDKHRLGRWHLRNPGHNLDFYVIGIADKTFRRCGRYPDQVFRPGNGWNWAVCKYKWVRLPFLSYQHRNLKFYFGWRERGNFGIELKL